MNERSGRTKRSGCGWGWRQGREGSHRPSWPHSSLQILCDETVCSDARRAGTCCSVMIQPLSTVALTRQDAVATVAAASFATAAAATAAASAGPAFALTSTA